MAKVSYVQEPAEGMMDDNLSDLCDQNKAHEGSKEPLKRFATVSPEDALKWMNEFPQRKEKFVAAVREGKNRDISA